MSDLYVLKWSKKQNATHIPLAVGNLEDVPAADINFVMDAPNAHKGTWGCVC
ncbi:MAG: hypothetical protein WAO76_10375 [Georgfuchsia sp.]